MKRQPETALGAERHLKQLRAFSWEREYYASLFPFEWHRALLIWRALSAHVPGDMVREVLALVGRLLCKINRAGTRITRHYHEAVEPALYNEACLAMLAHTHAISSWTPEER